MLEIVVVGVGAVSEMPERLKVTSSTVTAVNVANHFNWQYEMICGWNSSDYLEYRATMGRLYSSQTFPDYV